MSSHFSSASLIHHHTEDFSMVGSTFYTLVRFYQPTLVDFKQGNIHAIISSIPFFIWLSSFPNEE